MCVYILYTTYMFLCLYVGMLNLLETSIPDSFNTLFCFTSYTIVLHCSKNMILFLVCPP